jgi:hypothetical protein
VERQGGRVRMWGRGNPYQTIPYAKKKKKQLKIVLKGKG